MLAILSVAAAARPSHDGKKLAKPSGPVGDECLIAVGNLNTLCNKAPGKVEPRLALPLLSLQLPTLEKCADSGVVSPSLVEAVRYDLHRAEGGADTPAEADFRRWISDVRIAWRLGGRSEVTAALLNEGRNLETSKLAPGNRAALIWLREHLDGTAKGLPPKDVAMLAAAPVFEPELKEPVGNVCSHTPERHRNYMYDARFPLWEMAIAIALYEADAKAGTPPKEALALIDVLSQRDRSLVRAYPLAHLLEPVVSVALANAHRDAAAGMRALAVPAFAENMVLRLWPASMPILGERLLKPTAFFTGKDSSSKGNLLVPYTADEVDFEPLVPQFGKIFLHHPTSKGFLFGTSLDFPLEDAPGQATIQLKIKNGPTSELQGQPRPNLYVGTVGGHGQKKFPGRVDKAAMADGSFMFANVESALKWANPGSVDPDRHVFPDTASTTVTALDVTERNWFVPLLQGNKTLEEIDPAVLARRLPKNPMLRLFLAGRSEEAPPWLVSEALGSREMVRYMVPTLANRPIPQYLQNDVLEESVASYRGNARGHFAGLLTGPARDRLETWTPRALSTAPPTRRMSDVLAAVMASKPSDRMLELAAKALLDTADFSFSLATPTAETRQRLSVIFWREVRRRESNGATVELPDLEDLLTFLDSKHTAETLWDRMLDAKTSKTVTEQMVSRMTPMALDGATGLFARIVKDWPTLPPERRRPILKSFDGYYRLFTPEMREAFAEAAEKDVALAIETGGNAFALTPANAKLLLAKVKTRPLNPNDRAVLSAFSLMPKANPEIAEEFTRWLHSHQVGEPWLRAKAVLAVGGEGAFQKYVAAEEAANPGKVVNALLRVSQSGVKDREGMRELSDRIRQRGPSVFGGGYENLQSQPLALRRRIGEMLLAWQQDYSAVDGISEMGRDMEPLLRAAVLEQKRADSVAFHAANVAIANRRFSRDFSRWLLPELAKAGVKDWHWWLQAYDAGELGALDER